MCYVSPGWSMGRFMADLIQSLAPVDINTRERKQRERLLPFSNIGILNFAFFQTLQLWTSPFSKHWNSQFCLFLNIGILNFAFSKHWNSQFCLFLNIGILNFAFSKHWNSQFCHFYKHWNYKFCLFETLEFSILPFRNIGILSLPFSKYKVTSPFVTLKNRNVLRPLERKQPIVDGC